MASNITTGKWCTHAHTRMHTHTHAHTHTHTHTHTQVHPIFVLSIADCMLAVLWVVGGALWLTGVSHNRVWCFAVTLLTVVCVGCEGV